MRKDCEVASFSVTTESGMSGMRVSLVHGPNPVADLVFSRVSQVAIDQSDDVPALIVEITARTLPQYGPWPPEAQHLLHHHDNVAELTWVILEGSIRIEVLAEELVIESATCRAA